MFSQNEEEKIILDYFGDHNNGVFADLGCNDGLTLSNTRQLAINGWKGILVDPSPSAFAKVHSLYRGNPNFDLFNFALSDQDGSVILKDSGEHLGNGDSSLLSTIVPEETERWKGTTVFTDIEVKTITWKTLMSRSQFKQIHMFSIDCEGAEWSFLYDIDFDALDTKLICIEWNSKHQGSYDTLFNPIGFHLLHKNAENLIYVK